MIGGAILPVVFHQDPRYFYKGTGSNTSRALYAISTVFRAKGDDGHWEPNYSNLLGDFAAGAISNLYYPAADRGVQHTLDNAALTVVGNAASALVQEFVLRKLTRHPPPTVPPSPLTRLTSPLRISVLHLTQTQPLDAKPKTRHLQG